MTNIFIHFLDLESNKIGPVDIDCMTALALLRKQAQAEHMEVEALCLAHGSASPVIGDFLCQSKVTNHCSEEATLTAHQTVLAEDEIKRA